MIKKKIIKRKVWWLRKGEEGFLASNLWMNGANARLQARGFMLNHPRTKYRVIPIDLIYKD